MFSTGSNAIAGSAICAFSLQVSLLWTFIITFSIDKSFVVSSLPSFTPSVMMMRNFLFSLVDDVLCAFLKMHLKSSSLLHLFFHYIFRSLSIAKQSKINKIFCSHCVYYDRAQKNISSQRRLNNPSCSSSFSFHRKSIFLSFALHVA